MSEMEIQPAPEQAAPPPMEPPPEPLPAPAANIPPIAPPPPARRRGGAIWPLIGILAFLLLAAGEAYLFHLYRTVPPPPPDLSGEVTALQAKVAALESVPPVPVVAAPAPSAPAVPSAPTAPSAAAALSLPAPVDADVVDRLGTLNALVNALQTQFNADHNAVTSLQAASAGMPKLASDVAGLQAQASADHTTLTTLQSTAASLGKLTTRITVMTRLQTARMALDAGQPVGEIPTAPPALEKFADAPPPTEPALLLAFPDAARAAQSASVAGAAAGTYWSRVKARLENLVTVSAGDHVIIGAPAAAVLGHAQALLDAGDLAGAVAALNTLSATTQAAMGNWLTQARDLVAARNAISVLASQA